MPKHLHRRNLPAYQTEYQTPKASVSLQQEPGKETAQFIIRIQRQDMRDVLIRTDHNHATLLPVNAAHGEDISQPLVVDAEGFLVILQAELASAGLLQIRHVLVSELIEGLLEHGAKVDERIDILILAGVFHHG